MSGSTQRALERRSPLVDLEAVLSRLARAGARGLAGAGVCAFAACASSGPMPETEPDPVAQVPGVAPANTYGLARRVTGPVVLDETGAPLEFAWLGGLNQPRPQLADVDRDGDVDLFIQERSGRVTHFENVGDPRTPRFEWRSDWYGGIDVGEWYRFSDLDGDGAPDLLGESQFSHVKLWRNEGDGTGIGFPVWADSLRDVAGNPIFSDRQNIPNAIDMDCDGRVDLFIGRLTGTVTRYEERSDNRAGPPRFELLSDRFQNIEIVAQLGSMHGANTLALGDVDGDGDVDMFWGDFFEPGLLLIENTGTCERPDLTGAPVPFPAGDPILTSGYNAPTLADLDADGDPDLLVGVLGGAFNPNRTTVDNLLFVEQISPGAWEIKSRRFLRNLDVGSESVPAFGDWDGDGDADLLVANKIAEDGSETGRVFAFENTGGKGEARFEARGPIPIDGAYHLAPALGDLDGDGFAELLLGTWQDGIRVYRNRGSDGGGVDRWSADPEETISLSRGSNAVPALGDVDGDGDLDLVAGESSGELNLWRNDGTRMSPQFVLATDHLGEVDVGRRSAPVLSDWDGDGDVDLILGSESEGVTLWSIEPIEGEFELVRVADVLPEAPTFAAPAVLDLEHDGDPDLFVGGIGGGVVLYENLVR
jgi:hypothetical protein